MPSAQDIFNKLVELGDKLDTLNATSQAIKTDDDQLLSVVGTDLGEVIAADTYTNQALYQNALQNATIICLLEQISKNTCDLVNQATVQTRLQESIEKNTMRMAAVLGATHPEVALALDREEALRRDLEKCCPPELPPPACKQKPCASPKQIDPPPPGNVIQ
jgi:translation initiation factor IF-2